MLYFTIRRSHDQKTAYASAALTLAPLVSRIPHHMTWHLPFPLPPAAHQVRVKRFATSSTCTTVKEQLRMAEVEQKKGLEGVVIADTRLSKVYGDIGKLIYSGYNILDLAEHASFEEVVFLLWNARLPNQIELARFKESIIAEMGLPA